LRLAFAPGVQLSAALAALAVVAWFRAGQLMAFSAQTGFGYDFAAYWSAAERVIEGQSVYADFQLTGPYPPQVRGLYLYPPFLAAVLTPLKAVAGDLLTGAAVWAWGGLATVVVAAIVIARHHRLTWRGTAALATICLALPAVGLELFMGNVHMLLVALLAVSWLGIRRDDLPGDLLVGLTLAAAALIKIFPALLIVWLWLTGRRRAAALAVAAIPALMAATLPVTGLQDWLVYPLVLANLGPAVDPRSVGAPSVWLSTLVSPTAASALVISAALVFTAWMARRGPTATGFSAVVLASIAAAPALYLHYHAMAVLPLVLLVSHVGWRSWVLISYVAVFITTQLVILAPLDATTRSASTLALLLLLAVTALVRPTRPWSPVPASADSRAA
jgi:alpha-1,2-mannosyltransferase